MIYTEDKQKVACLSMPLFCHLTYWNHHTISFSPKIGPDTCHSYFYVCDIIPVGVIGRQIEIVFAVCSIFSKDLTIKNTILGKPVCHWFLVNMLASSSLVWMTDLDVIRKSDAKFNRTLSFIHVRWYFTVKIGSSHLSENVEDLHLFSKTLLKHFTCLWVLFCFARK